MKLIITEAKEYRQSFETAAWYTIHIIQPGEYEVVDKGKGAYGQPYLVVEVRTIIKEDYKPSLWCGSYISKEPYVDDRAGKEGSIVLSTDYYAFKETNLEHWGTLV